MLNRIKNLARKGRSHFFRGLNFALRSEVKARNVVNLEAMKIGTPNGMIHFAENLLKSAKYSKSTPAHFLYKVPEFERSIYESIWIYSAGGEAARSKEFMNAIAKKDPQAFLRACGGLEQARGMLSSMEKNIESLIASTQECQKMLRSRPFFDSNGKEAMLSAQGSEPVSKLPQNDRSLFLAVQGYSSFLTPALFTVENLKRKINGEKK